MSTAVLNSVLATVSHLVAEAGWTSPVAIGVGIVIVIGVIGALGASGGGGGGGSRGGGCGCPSSG